MCDESDLCVVTRAACAHTTPYNHSFFHFYSLLSWFFRFAPSRRSRVPKRGRAELAAASRLQPSPELNAEGRQRDLFDRTVFIYFRQMGLKRLRIPNQQHYFPNSKRLTSNRAPDRYSVLTAFSV